MINADIQFSCIIISLTIIVVLLTLIMSKLESLIINLVYATREIQKALGHTNPNNKEDKK